MCLSPGSGTGPDDFDYTANSAVTPEVVATLTEPAWVAAGQPLCLIGDSGTGKSHLLIGIELKVRYTTDPVKC